VLHLELANAKARLKARHCRAGKISKKHSTHASRGSRVQKIPKASPRKRSNGFRVRLTIGR